MMKKTIPWDTFLPFGFPSLIHVSSVEASTGHDNYHLSLLSLGMNIFHFGNHCDLHILALVLVLVGRYLWH